MLIIIMSTSLPCHQLPFLFSIFITFTYLLMLFFIIKFTKKRSHEYDDSLILFNTMQHCALLGLKI